MLFGRMVPDKYRKGRRKLFKKFDYDDPRDCSKQHMNLLIFSSRYVRGSAAFDITTDFGFWLEMSTDLVAGTLSFMKSGALPEDLKERVRELEDIRDKLNLELSSKTHNEERRFYFHQILSSISWILLWSRCGMEPFERRRKRLAEINRLKKEKEPILDSLENPILRQEIMGELEILRMSGGYWDKDYQPGNVDEKSLQEVLIEEHSLNKNCFKNIGVFLVDENEAIAVQETCSMFAQIIRAHPDLSNHELSTLKEWSTVFESAEKTVHLLNTNTPYIADYLFDLKYPPGYVYEEE